VASESPGSWTANESSLWSTGEQEYGGDVANRNEPQPFGKEPDVVLDVPVLNIDEMDLEVEDLQARVSLQAELADLVSVNVGVHINLGKVKLEIKGLEAQALLKVRLDRILGTIDRALEAIDHNPQIISGAFRAVDQTSQETDRTKQAMEGTTGQAAGAVERTGQEASGLLDETSDEAERTTQSTSEESGNAAEAISNESGDAVGEKVAGNLAGLPIEEEYIDEEGRIVGRARDESGNVVEDFLDEEGNVPDSNVLEEEDRVAEDTGEVEATDAARRRARELGVRLYDLEGTGSGGRILVRDVKGAAG
jgi:pyruvate/2-oxoglutarate dehydrogenase complex dihydrolipoamide acyltransferase (E2) component